MVGLLSSVTVPALAAHGVGNGGLGLGAHTAVGLLSASSASFSIRVEPLAA